MEYVYKFIHKWLLFLKRRHKSRSRWSRVNGNLINMGDYLNNYANPTAQVTGQENEVQIVELNQQNVRRDSIDEL